MRRKVRNLDRLPTSDRLSTAALKATNAYRTAVDAFNSALNNKDYKDEDKNNNATKGDTLTKSCKCVDTASHFN
jgi:hypothetical protein